MNTSAAKAPSRPWRLGGRTHDARAEWAALAAIVAVALLLRVYAIDRVPGLVFHDECDNLVNAYQILNGRGPWFFGFDWKPQPAASVYVLSLFVGAWDSVAALRLPAALYGTLSLIPFYLLLRQVVAAAPALLTTALLAGDMWHLHFSRSGWENIASSLCLVGAALAVQHALRTGRLAAFALAGVWSALGAYGYFAGRTVLAAVLVALLFACWRPPMPRRRLVLGIGVTTVTAVALFAPQLPAIARNWETFNQRASTVMILGGERGDRSLLEQAGVLARSFTRKSRQLFVGRRGVTDDPYLRLDPAPLLLPTRILLGAGLLLSLRRRPGLWLWWVFLLVPFLLTIVLTTGYLNGARGVVFLPILYLFVGLGVDAAWRLCRTRVPRLTAPLVAGVLAVAAAGVWTYADWIQSPEVLEALQPAVPLAEFELWQDYVRRWTAWSDDFFNVNMWQELTVPPPDACPAAAPTTS